MLKSVMRDPNHLPRLLVSVRDADEAVEALAGGADIVDVKEPLHGSLGAADANAIGQVVGVIGGRVPVSIAAGELSEYPPANWRFMARCFAEGVTYVKWGLAGCRDRADWPGAWREAALAFGGIALPVAVVYADWEAAAAPRPGEIVDHARSVGCAAVLVDTWDKSSGGLFDHWSLSAVEDICDRAHSAELSVALAGSLCGSTLARAACAGADIIAIRGAACTGGRTGRISAARVLAIRDELLAANQPQRTAKRTLHG